MATIANEPQAGFDNPRWIPVQPDGWVAEYDGTAAGSIDRTTRGRYRATDRHGRKVGSFRSLDQAQERLTASNSASLLQRLDQSKLLVAIGFVLLAITTLVGIVGLSLVLRG